MSSPPLFRRVLSSGRSPTNAENQNDADNSTRQTTLMSRSTTTYIDTNIPHATTFARSWTEGISSPVSSSSGRVSGSDGVESDHVGTYSNEEVTVSPLDPHYVYYRMFVEHEPILPKKPVFQNDHLGRITATSVAPPHSVNSLKRCITKSEGFFNAPECDLFADMTSRSPMAQGPISIFTNDRLGSTPEKPIALVYSSSTRGVAPTISTAIAVDSRFNQRVVAIQNFHNSSVNQKFLNFKVGEILLTDGISRREMFAGGGGGKSAAQPFRVYEAINSVGSKGFVIINAVRPIPAAAD